LLLVSFVHVQGNKNKYALVNGHQSVRLDKVPTNIHGDSEFLVKLQAPVGAVLASVLANTGSGNPRTVLETHGISLTDQSRSFLAIVEPGSAGHADLVDILLGVGRPGRSGAGKVAYVYAKREGPKLRLFVEGLPDQQQVW
jgi:hypothetical protein